MAAPLNVPNLTSLILEAVYHYSDFWGWLEALLARSHCTLTRFEVSLQHNSLPSPIDEDTFPRLLQMLPSLTHLTLRLIDYGTFAHVVPHLASLTSLTKLKVLDLSLPYNCNHWQQSWEDMLASMIEARWRSPSRSSTEIQQVREVHLRFKWKFPLDSGFCERLQGLRKDGLAIFIDASITNIFRGDLYYQLYPY
jgi:hypothetical protein